MAKNDFYNAEKQNAPGVKVIGNPWRPYQNKDEGIKGKKSYMADALIKKEGKIVKTVDLSD